MTPSNNLFELIKSLSKSEKGYFKKYAQIHVRGDENNYIKLFDEIEKQNEYNEEKLLKKFKNEKFTNNFSVAKAYLYTIILKSLVAFHNDVSVEIRNYLNQIEILYRKSLLKHCEKIIRKAKEIAYKYELYNYLYEILFWELEYLDRTKSDRSDTEKILKLYEEILKVSDLLRENAEFKEASGRIKHISADIGFIKTEDDRKRIEEIIQSPIFKSDKNLQTFESKYNYYYTWMNYYFVYNDLEKAYPYINKIYKLWTTEYSEYIEFRFTQYCATIYNKLNIGYSIKKFRDVEELLPKLPEIKTKLKEKNNKFFYDLYNVENALNIDRGNLERCIEISDEIEELLKHEHYFRPNKIQEYTFNYICGYVYFCKGDYSASLKFLNRILNDNVTDIRNDLHIYSRLLSLLIHSEMKHFDYLTHFMKSVKRFLTNNQSLNEMENLVLKFINDNIIKTAGDKIQKTKYEELRGQILQICENDPSKNSFFASDFITWIDSKIEGKPMGEILRAKYQAALEKESQMESE